MGKDAVISLRSFSVEIVSDGSFVLTIFYRASDGSDVENDVYTFSTSAKLVKFVKKELLTPKAAPAEVAE